MRQLLSVVVVMMVGLAALAVACGPSGSNDSSVIEIKAEAPYSFSPSTIEVPAGKIVTLRLKNTDKMEHDLDVRGLMPASVEGGGHGRHDEAGKRSVAVHTAAGKTGTVKFRADAKGTYEVVCTISGHEQLGMVAKLVVV